MAFFREKVSREVPYWRRVLEYGAAGGLQAVLDEYAHVLREAHGLLDESPETMAHEISRAMREALGIRTSNITVPNSRALGRERPRAGRRGIRPPSRLRNRQSSTLSSLRT
jgi:hypothetical protein